MATETIIERSAAASAPREKAATKAPLCFVISPIGAEGSDVRKIADKVLKHVIAKALDERYVIQRADEIAKPGLITAQIVERLLDAPLVVADLSDGNANVYYELAIRHAANKPVIHIIADGQDAPFDVKDMRFVLYDLKDPDSIDRAQQNIRTQSELIQKGDQFITPVQVAQILAPPSTGKEDKLAVKMFGAIYAAISNLQQEIRETKETVQFLANAETGGVSWKWTGLPGFNALQGLGRRGNLSDFVDAQTLEKSLRSLQEDIARLKAGAPDASVADAENKK